MINEKVNCIDCLASGLPSTGRALRGTTAIVHAEAAEHECVSVLWAICELNEHGYAVHIRHDAPEGEWYLA